ncbi:TM2 domain-containing protein [Slackia isoflavoniconvertens]|nr:TM2 domain-containing protein [Slackia isoflavoniconvertens]
MAEEAKNSAAAHAAEIEALKRQIEEMNKRLEELSAATSAGAPAEGDSSALAASAEVAEVVEPAIQARGNAEEEGGVEAKDVVEGKGVCSSDSIEGAEEALEVESIACCKASDGEVEELPRDEAAESAGRAEAGPGEGALEGAISSEAPAIDSGMTGSFVAETNASAVEAVPAPAPNVPAAAPEASGVFPNTPPIEKVVDDDGKPVDPAYVAAAVADFMPTSQPPKPAPPVFNGVPYGQQGAVSQQPTCQPQQPYAQPGYAAQQPYAQQPGQAAYYSQSNGYYASSQGAYQVPYQQPLVHTKDHVAAGLLAIFLGVFGVHKFYLGYHTTGFIMLGVTILGSLLTIGIAAGVVWLIGVIEGIIYLTKSQSEFEQLYVFNKREMF